MISMTLLICTCESERLAPRWCIGFEVRLLRQSCHPGTMPWLIALVIPARIVNRDS
jgi:hypothetical protein